MTHYTTIEQAKHLVELGLDPKTADMFYPWHIADEEDTFEDGYLLDTPMIGKYGSRGTIPCWSIGALLELMPESHQLTRGKDNKYQFMLFHILIHDWFNTPLEAVYNMVCYLLKNGYIKKEI